MANGHYLEKDRLSNVIAAIQLLGVSDRTAGTLNRWVAELEASEELTPEQLERSPVKYAERKKWAAVFEQHPEFFKSYSARGEQHVMLRWRYAQSFHPDPTKVENSASEDPDKPNDVDKYVAVSSKPLSADQLQVLINTAIELHGKEAAADRPPDRWPPILLTAIGAALGTVVGGTAVVLLGWMQMMRAVRIFD
jgi:hypothetical protein